MGLNKYLQFVFRCVYDDAGDVCVCVFVCLTLASASEVLRQVICPGLAMCVFVCVCVSDRTDKSKLVGGQRQG